jgi:hypothetical protein
VDSESTAEGGGAEAAPEQDEGDTGAAIAEAEFDAGAKSAAEDEGKAENQGDATLSKNESSESLLKAGEEVAKLLAAQEAEKKAKQDLSEAHAKTREAQDKIAAMEREALQLKQEADLMREAADAQINILTSLGPAGSADVAAILNEEPGQDICKQTAADADAETAAAVSDAQLKKELLEEAVLLEKRGQEEESELDLEYSKVLSVQDTAQATALQARMAEQEQRNDEARRAKHAAEDALRTAEHKLKKLQQAAAVQRALQRQKAEGQIANLESQQQAAAEQESMATAVGQYERSAQQQQMMLEQRLQQQQQQQDEQNLQHNQQLQQQQELQQQQQHRHQIQQIQQQSQLEQQQQQQQHEGALLEVAHQMEERVNQDRDLQEQVRLLEARLKADHAKQLAEKEREHLQTVRAMILKQKQAQAAMSQQQADDGQMEQLRAELANNSLADPFACEENGVMFQVPGGTPFGYNNYNAAAVQPLVVQVPPAPAPAPAVGFHESGPTNVLPAGLTAGLDGAAERLRQLEQQTAVRVAVQQQREKQQAREQQLASAQQQQSQRLVDEMRRAKQQAQAKEKALSKAKTQVGELQTQLNQLQQRHEQQQREAEAGWVGGLGLGLGGMGGGGMGGGGMGGGIFPMSGMRMGGMGMGGLSGMGGGGMNVQQQAQMQLNWQSQQLLQSQQQREQQQLNLAVQKAQDVAEEMQNQLRSIAVQQQEETRQQELQQRELEREAQQAILQQQQQQQAQAQADQVQKLTEALEQQQRVLEEKACIADEAQKKAMELLQEQATMQKERQVRDVEVARWKDELGKRQHAHEMRAKFTLEQQQQQLLSREQELEQVRRGREQEQQQQQHQIAELHKRQQDIGQYMAGPAGRALRVQMGLSPVVRAGAIASGTEAAASSAPHSHFAPEVHEVDEGAMQDQFERLYEHAGEASGAGGDEAMFMIAQRMQVMEAAFAGLLDKQSQQGQTATAAPAGASRRDEPWRASFSPPKMSQMSRQQEQRSYGRTRPRQNDKQRKQRPTYRFIDREGGRGEGVLDRRVEQDSWERSSDDAETVIGSEGGDFDMANGGDSYQQLWQKQLWQKQRQRERHDPRHRRLNRNNQRNPRTSPDDHDTRPFGFDNNVQLQLAYDNALRAGEQRQILQLMRHTGPCLHHLRPKLQSSLCEAFVGMLAPTSAMGTYSSVDAVTGEAMQAGAQSSVAITAEVLPWLSQAVECGAVATLPPRVRGMISTVLHTIWKLPGAFSVEAGRLGTVFGA